MKKCKYSSKYQATRHPTCGCDVCWVKWEESCHLKNIEQYGKKGADLIKKHPRATREDFERLDAIAKEARKGIRRANKMLKELDKMGL